MPFIGGTDPDGWIICDGTTRTCTDSRFSDLSVILNTYMSVDTNTANSITPPDLRSKFIRGHDVSTTTTQSTGGANSVTLTVSNMPSHNHTINVTNPAHSHTISITDPGHSHKVTAIDKGHDHPIQTYTGISDGNHIANPYYPSGQDTVSKIFGEGLPYTNTGYAQIEATCSGSNTGITASCDSATTSISATSTTSGSGTAFNILPSYYSMNYIMKY